MNVSSEPAKMPGSGKRERDPDEGLADQQRPDDRADDEPGDPERQRPVVHDDADDRRRGCRRRRPDDRAARSPRTGVQVLGRLEQPAVDLLERHVQRQRHERQEVVGDAGDDGGRRREQLEVRGQEADRP